MYLSLQPLPEVAMASPFSEFSKTYDQFRKLFPDHSLTDELRSRIGRGKLPNDQWLKAKTKRMKDLMTPLWLKANQNSSLLQRSDSLDHEA